VSAASLTVEIQTCVESVAVHAGSTGTANQMVIIPVRLEVLTLVTNYFIFQKQTLSMATEADDCCAFTHGVKISNTSITN